MSETCWQFSLLCTIFTVLLVLILKPLYIKIQKFFFFSHALESCNITIRLRGVFNVVALLKPYPFSHSVGPLIFPDLLESILISFMFCYLITHFTEVFKCIV